MSGNTVWPQASNFQKIAKMNHFWPFFNELLSTQNVNVARNVKWDFFYDFQTLWCFILKALWSGKVGNMPSIMTKFSWEERCLETQTGAMDWLFSPDETPNWCRIPEKPNSSELPSIDYSTLSFWELSFSCFVCACFALLPVVSGKLWLATRFRYVKKLSPNFVQIQGF